MNVHWLTDLTWGMVIDMIELLSTSDNIYKTILFQYNLASTKPNWKLTQPHILL